MFGKVSDDSFTHIFDLSLDSEDSRLSSFNNGASTGLHHYNHSPNKMMTTSNSSSPMSSRRDFSSSPSTPSSASSLPLEAAFSQFAASFTSLLADKESAASAALSLDKKICELERLRNKINSESHSSASSTTSSNGSNANSKVNTARYKTELCRPFSEHGTCKYGEKCQFAHGQSELRTVTRHPKYKTDLCRTYHSVGFCPYGPRCHFIHNLEEAANPVVQKQQQQQTAQPQTGNLNKPIGSGRIAPHNKDNQVQLQLQQPQPQQPLNNLQKIKPLPMFDNHIRNKEKSSNNGWNPLNSNLFGQEQQKSRLPVFSTLSK